MSAVYNPTTLAGPPTRHGPDFVILVKSSIRAASALFWPSFGFAALPMHTLDAAAAVTGALTAFLRTVERRAALLAELQTGDPAQGDQAFFAAVATFAQEARPQPETEWPVLFWSTLLQTPALAAEPLAPFWAGDFAPLARLEFGPRAALLLRLVGQLDDTQASTVVGVDVQTYRQLLQASVPQRPEGGPDGEAWLAMRDEARAAVEHMGVERLAGIARAREAAVIASLTPPDAEPAPARGLPQQLSGLTSGWLSRFRDSLKV
jgi:hypothetical protein